MHTALGYAAMAEGKTQEALDELRRGDVAYDGAPAHECAPCLPYDLARAFDAGGMPDSAIFMYERYLTTPYWLKARAALDPVRVPTIHERLGQLHEAAGRLDKAAEHYRTFIDIWKNADPELQPRVAVAREKLRRMALDSPRN